MERSASNNNHTSKSGKRGISIPNVSIPNVSIPKGKRSRPIPKGYKLNLSNHTELKNELNNINDVITSTEAAIKANECFETFKNKFKILLERTCNSEKVDEILQSLTTNTLNEHISFIRHFHNSLSKLLYLCDIDDNNLFVKTNQEFFVSSICDDDDDVITLTVKESYPQQTPAQKKSLKEYSEFFDLNHLNKLYRQTNAHRNIKYDSIVIKVYIHDIKIHYFLTSKYLSDLFIATMYKGCGDNWPFLTYDMYRYHKKKTLTPDLYIYDSTNDSTIEITPIIDARFMNDNEPWIINIHSGNIVYTNKGIITLKIVYDMLIIIEMIRQDYEFESIEQFSEIKIELVNGLNGWYLQLEYGSNIYKNGEDYQKVRTDKPFPKKINNLNLVFKVYDQALTEETRLHMIYIKILLSIFGHDYSKRKFISNIDIKIVNDNRKWLINNLYNMLLKNSDINNMYSISDKYTSGLVLPTNGKTTLVVYYSKPFESSSIPKEYEYYHVNMESYENDCIAKIKYKTSTPENLFGLGINKSLMMYSSATLNQFLSFHCELPTYEHITKESKKNPMSMTYRGDNPIIVSGEQVLRLDLNIKPLWSDSFFSKKNNHVIPFFIPCFRMIVPMAFKPNTNINNEINIIQEFLENYDITPDYDITPEKLNTMKIDIEADYNIHVYQDFFESHYSKVKKYIFSNILCKCINYFKDIYQDKDNVLIAKLIFAVIDQNSLENKQLLDQSNHNDVALCINEHLDDVFNTYKQLNVDFKCIFQPGSPLDINNYLVHVDFFKNKYTSSLSTKAVQLVLGQKDEYFKSFKTGYITFLIDKSINKEIIDVFDKNVTLLNNTGTRLTFNIEKEKEMPQGRPLTRQQLEDNKSENQKRMDFFGIQSDNKISDNEKLKYLLGIADSECCNGYKLKPEDADVLYKQIVDEANNVMMNTDNILKKVSYSLYKRHDNLYDEDAKVVVGTFEDYGMFNGHVIYDNKKYWGVLYEDSDIEIKEEIEMNLPTGKFYINSSNWWKEMLDKIKDIIKIIYFRNNFSKDDFCKLIEELNIYEELLEIYVKKIKDFILIIGIDPNNDVKDDTSQFSKIFRQKLNLIKAKAQVEFGNQFGNELDGNIPIIYKHMRNNDFIPEDYNTQINDLAKRKVVKIIINMHDIFESYDILSELYPANSYIDDINDYKTIFEKNLQRIIPIVDKQPFKNTQTSKVSTTFTCVYSKTKKRKR